MCIDSLVGEKASFDVDKRSDRDALQSSGVNNNAAASSKETNGSEQAIRNKCIIKCP
jgi:hypothetical protein